MNRTEMRRCGRQYATEEEALRSKAGRKPGAGVTSCRCGKFHLTFPPEPAAAPRKPQAGTGAATGLPKPLGEFSPAVRLLVRTRAGNGEVRNAMCEACGLGLGRYGGQVHHVVNRGMGGSRDEIVNSAANAALLCGTPDDKDTCHGKATALDPELGPLHKAFWLPQGTDPRLVPMALASEHGSGIRVWRAADGLGPDGTGYLLQAPEARAA